MINPVLLLQGKDGDSPLVELTGLINFEKGIQKVNHMQDQPFGRGWGELGRRLGLKPVPKEKRTAGLFIRDLESEDDYYSISEIGHAFIDKIEQSA